MLDTPSTMVRPPSARSATSLVKVRHGQRSQARCNVCCGTSHVIRATWRLARQKQQRLNMNEFGMADPDDHLYQQTLCHLPNLGAGVVSLMQHANNTCFLDASRPWVSLALTSEAIPHRPQGHRKTYAPTWWRSERFGTSPDKDNTNARKSTQTSAATLSLASTPTSCIWCRASVGEPAMIAAELCG